MTLAVSTSASLITQVDSFAVFGHRCAPTIPAVGLVSPTVQDLDTTGAEALP
jgi:hypothetical protein